MAQGSFTATVQGWTEQTKDDMVWVYKESAQRLVEVMQATRSMGGNLRFETGFLRASLVATTGALPSVTFKPDGVDHFSYDAAQINLVIVGADISQPISIVYTANYARPREYGSNGQLGDRWVGLAAQQWQRVVSEVAAEAQSRAGG